jgi:hypothetical protein
MLTQPHLDRHLREDRCGAASPWLDPARRRPLATSAAFLGIRAIVTDDDLGEARTEEEPTTFTTALRADMANTPPSAASAATFAGRTFAFLNLDALARTCVEYSTGDLLATMVDAITRPPGRGRGRGRDMDGRARRLRRHRSDPAHDRPQEQRV